MLKSSTFLSKTGRKRRGAGLAALDLGRGQTIDWLCVAVLSGAAFALAIAHPWSHAYIGEAQYGDAAYWDFAGENWARGYFSTKAPDIRPGYSVFLGLVYALTGADFHHAFVAQALLFGSSVGLVYSIGKLIRGRLAGTLAAALLAFDPYMWEWVATSTTELVGSFANLVALYFIVRGCRSRRSKWNMAFFGLWLAIANIVRPVTLLFVVPAVLCLVLLRCVAWRRRLAESGVAITAVGLGLMPGILYQYYMTGDPGLSSNSAANLFAASSPTYLTWTPSMYDDVSRDLQVRGIAVTEESRNAEFTRLTILNYLQYPGFQAQRIVDGFGSYGEYEGEADRPERFTFYRPWLLAFGVASVLILSAVGVASRWWAVLPGLVLLGGLVWQPAQTLIGLQVAGLVLPLAAPAALRRDSRRLSWLLVALFWVTTGLVAILSTGIAGFFLNRLYTQVEPERALLLALAAVQLSQWPMGRRRRAAVFQAGAAMRRWRFCLPSGTSVLALRVAGVGAGVVVGAGLLRLFTVNVQSPDSQRLPTPSTPELSAAVQRWGLPGPVRYVTESDFQVTRNLLMSGEPPKDTTVYAVPGEYTRFLWYLEDQDRTLFWYVFSDRSRPLTLDKSLLTGESTGHLPVSSFGTQRGLLFIAPTSAYFDQTGVVMLQNVLTARAFAPWDPLANRFRIEDAQVFALSTPLYDDAHFKAAVHDGSVLDAGPLRLGADGKLLRALAFRPLDSGPGAAREASLTFHNVWVPPGSDFRVNLSLQPRLYGHLEVGRTDIEVAVTIDGQVPVPIVQRKLDPSVEMDVHFAQVSADLAQFAGQNVDVTLRAIADPAATATSEVLFGEPQVLMR